MKINQSFNQRMTTAVSFHQKGNLSDAEKLYLNILSDYPNHPDVLHLLGVACSQQGKMDKAINYINMAIIFNPNNPEYYSNLGETYNRAEKPNEAITNFRKAINLVPNFAMAHYNLANTLKKIGQEQEAIKHYQEAIKYLPNNPEFYYNLGNSFRDLGMYRSAIETYQTGLKINSNNPNMHNNLAATLTEMDNVEEAKYHYQQSIKLNPDFEDAYSNLSGLNQKQGYISEAISNIEKVQKIKASKGDHSKNNLLELSKKSIFPIIPQSNNEIDSYIENLSQLLDKIDVSSFTSDDFKKFEVYPPSIITYYGRDNKELKEKYYNLYKNSFKTYTKRNVNLKPHIGFVVTHGHEGVFIKCMSGIINNISKEKFKITLVCSQPNGEKILRSAIKSQEVNYLSIPHDLDKAAEIIYQNYFDILHYWEIGTDAINYFLPYYNTANIQCTTWGWPDTSGINNLNYYISCENFEMPESDSHYSETLIKLHNLPTYYYKPPIPEQIKPRQHFNLKEDSNIYLCAQNVRKVHPDFDQIVFKILEKDPKAQILFIGDKQENLTNTLKNRILNQSPEYKDQIRFMTRIDESEYLSLVKISDVILDTLYYTGGANTNYDAFACGTPVVTMPTKHHRGKYTAGVYQKLGIDDCIATSIDDYAEIAVKIASDKNYRAELSQKILNKSEMLFEDMKAVRELEDCFISLLKGETFAPLINNTNSNNQLSTNNLSIPSNQMITTVMDSGGDLFVNNSSVTNSTSKLYLESNFNLQNSTVTVPEINFGNSNLQNNSVVDFGDNFINPTNPLETKPPQKKDYTLKIPSEILKTKKYPSLSKILDKKIIIDITDIGAANVDQKPIYQDLLDSDNANVIGFEPNLKALEMLNQTKKDCENYFPYTIADGKKHNLSFCEMYGFTSILKPDYKILDNFNYYSHWASIYKTMEVDTKRLDDIQEIKNIDFLKLDIQGGELLVLENSANKIKECLVIQTEVSFVPMYENQALFAEIDIFLRQQGFMLHNLFSIERRLLTPIRDDNDMFAGLNQMVQADAVYIKDMSKFNNLSQEQLLKFALIVHDIYKSYDLALRLLITHDNDSSTNYADLYFNYLHSS